MIEAFRKDYAMSFPTLVADPSQYLVQFKQQAREYMQGTPTFLLYDRRGKLSVVNPGPVHLNRIEAFSDEQDG